MPVRIAIPEPAAMDADYNARSLPPYLAALQSAGATPILIPLRESPDHVARLLVGTQGILLPGSKFDVDPERYGEARLPKCGPDDPRRTAVDELLLQDAFNLHKPILAVCHGAQTLNVWLGGSLIQDLASVLNTPVNHSPGRDIIDAHPLHIAAGSKLAKIAGSPMHDVESQCNSSHHQAIGRVGDHLRVTAVSPQDQVIEAVELDSPDHFVLGVQWHPERTCSVRPLSRSIFTTFVRAAEEWKPRKIETSVVRP